MMDRFTVGLGALWLVAVLIVACEPLPVPPADQRAVEAPRIMRAASTDECPDIRGEWNDGESLVYFAFQTLYHDWVIVGWWSYDSTTCIVTVEPNGGRRLVPGHQPDADSQTFYVRGTDGGLCLADPAARDGCLLDVTETTRTETPVDPDGGNPNNPGPRNDDPGDDDDLEDNEDPCGPPDPQEGKPCGWTCGGVIDYETGERGDCTENDPTRVQLVVARRDDCTLYCAVPRQEDAK